MQSLGNFQLCPIQCEFFSSLPTKLSLRLVSAFRIVFVGGRGYVSSGLCNNQPQTRWAENNRNDLSHHSGGRNLKSVSLA